MEMIVGGKPSARNSPYFSTPYLGCRPAKAQRTWIRDIRQAASSAGAFKVSRYYHTDWIAPDKLPLHLDGLNLDAVYENFVRQIAGDALDNDSGETLKESVDRSKKKAELEKRIAVLEAKIRKEKQLNRQMEMNAVLKKRKQELENIL